MHDIILTPKRVTVSGCKNEGRNILLQIQDGTELQYVGGADFVQVREKTQNKSITLGVDPSDKYCALLEEVYKQQLR